MFVKAKNELARTNLFWTLLIVYPSCFCNRRKKGESTLCFSSLEKILNGARSLSPQIIKKVTEIFPRAQISSGYG